MSRGQKSHGLTVEDVVKILVWMGFIPGVRGVEMIQKRKAIIVSKQHIFLGMSMILMRTLSCRNWILVTIDRAVSTYCGCKMVFVATIAQYISRTIS